MRSNRMIRALQLMAASALLSACSSDLPGSFQVGSVEIDDTADVAAVLSWYAPPANDRRTIGLLRVEMVSPVDLVSFARDHGFSVGYVAYYCGGAAGEPRRDVYSTAYPMVGGRTISSGSSISPTDMASARGVDGQIRYTFFVPLDEQPLREVYGELRKKSNIALPLYDYKATPDDLCFQIRGGDMLGRTYASAPISIRREDVLVAVAHRRVQ
jgi:hypothetical protein